jgi:lipoprotein NlpD
MGSKTTKGRGRHALVLAACVAIAGCATDPAPVEDRSLGGNLVGEPAGPAAKINEGSYRVVRGDTLYAIAFKRGLDYRDVASWNGIAPPYTILVGQELRLTPSPGGSRTAVAVAPASSSASPISNSVVSSGTKSTTVGAATVAASTAAANKGSMFEDVPSQFSPPARVDAEAAPAVAAAAQNKSPVAPAASSAAAETERSATTPKPAAATASPAVVEAPPAAAPAPIVASRPTTPPAAEPAPVKPANDSATASVNGVAWRWPSSGKMLGGFVGGDQTKQGIDIGGNAGDAVNAAADGEVVYSGNGLIGYGELIIVKHSASFLSAYGHNRKRLVQEGEKVRAGQQIAEMGSSASSRDELHFEIRKNGKPVNPLEFLPSR